MMRHSKDLIVEVHDLTVAYEDKPVLWDVDFHCPSGVLMAVVGPNGAGKSTLIKTILGLIMPVAGSIKVLHKNIDKVRHLVGYVPQRNSVDWDFPASVLDVVLMGRYGHLGWFKRPGHQEVLLAKSCLDKVGMADFANRHISQLSGGQQQRVFIARAFMQQAEVYLMDEPFAGVDALTEKSIIGLLKELKAQGKTVICVHHDLQTLKEYFDEVCLLNIRCIAQGGTQQVLTNENLKKAYGGKAAFLTGI